MKSDNKATAFGGCVYECGSFTMEGGTIKGNSADHGGGVDTENNFVLSGSAVIVGNTANLGGGVFVENEITMNGGRILSNTAQKTGGGVYNSSAFILNGGTISENTAIENGGGVYNNYSLTVSGNPVVTNNHIGSGTTNNVFLPNGNVITVSGEMKEAAEIGITLADTSAVITSGFGSKSKLALPKLAFVSDDNTWIIGTNGATGNNMEAQLTRSYTVTFEVYGADFSATGERTAIAIDIGKNITYGAYNASTQTITFTSIQGGGAVETVIRVPAIKGYTPYVFNLSDRSEVLSGAGVLASVSTNRQLGIGYKANENTPYAVYYILQNLNGNYVTGTTPDELQGESSVFTYDTGTATTDSNIVRSMYLDTNGHAYVTFPNSEHYSFDKVAGDLIIKGDGSSFVLVYLKLNEYTVRFTASGAVPGMQTKTLKFGSALTLDGIEEPVKNMNTFRGWYYDEDCTDGNEVNFANLKVSGDLILYAKFASKSYSLIFDLNVGSGANQLPTDSALLVMVNSANLYGHVVTWDTASLFNESFKFSEVGSGKYQISYDVNNVSSNKNITGIRPSAIGYTFGGWWVEGATTQTTVIRRPSASTSTEEPIVLKARWTPATYTMRF
ncbi:MAG: InlB B-repeat-containing protein, partial [Clostridia bacterium]|nr:InlB B-repeat-containing protein [Clostridia bacterium]